jgi:hypothetical protein
LEGGPPGFTRSSTSSALLRIPLARLPSSPTGLSPAPVPLSIGFGRHAGAKRGPTTPAPKGRFGLSRFRSPLLTGSRLISLPPGTEMFQFPGFASATYIFSCGYDKTLRPCRGFPHSDIPVSQPGWRLLRAFRGLPRPSSPPDAKASTMYPSQLGHLCSPSSPKLLVIPVPVGRFSPHFSPIPSKTKRTDTLSATTAFHQPLRNEPNRPEPGVTPTRTNPAPRGKDDEMRRIPTTLVVLSSLATFRSIFDFQRSICEAKIASQMPAGLTRRRRLLLLRGRPQSNRTRFFAGPF